MALELEPGDVVTMAGQTIHERIARLEANEVTRDLKLEEIKTDLKTLISKFDQLTGGKKVLIGIASIIGAIIAAVIGWVFRHAGHT